jgi:branched-chain amino acid transport system ATP-binding protein
MIEVSNLEVTYKGAIKALHGVSFNVQRGESVAILGANGAGKTTILRALSGFIGLDNAKITQGAVHFEGINLTHLPPHKIMQQGLVIIPERDKVFPNLTIAENLEAASKIGQDKAERARLLALVYTLFPRLALLREKMAGLLSGGERQMLAISAALICAPKILCIDELSLGLAPVITHEIAEKLNALKAELNLTLLIVEQSANVALKMANRAYVLENGRIVLEGSAQELADNPAIKEAYLGKGGGYKDALIQKEALVQKEALAQKEAGLHVA